MFPALVQSAFLMIVLTACAIPLGRYMERVFTGKPVWLDRLFVPVERGLYRLAGVDPTEEMDWVGYTKGFIQALVAGTLLLYIILRIQEALPFGGLVLAPMTPDLAANTAVSFSTTTTWQSYAGETAMTPVGTALGLIPQSMLAGAAGLAVGIAFIRGFARRNTEDLGNFWVDLTRATLWVMVPLSVVISLLMIWQGTVMDDAINTRIAPLFGEAARLPLGPVAALESITDLGTNGAGAFNVNSAHPFENPTPFTNLLQSFAIMIIPAAVTITFGRMIRQPRQGWLLYIAMTILFVAGVAAAGWLEETATPGLAASGVNLAVNPDGVTAPGGNMEGKEIRFGIGASAMTAVVTSNGATGSYNSMHDSYTPLGGMVPLINMMLGEIIFGGAGAGLFSIIFVVLFGFFLSGLMSGRAPSYLGKQIGPAETRLVTLSILLTPITILFFSAIALIGPGLSGLVTNSGAHGLTEIVFAYASSYTNNGQNMAGLNANSYFYNATTAIVMLVGRVGLGVIALMLAGQFARQNTSVRPGSLFMTDGLFISILIGTSLLVGLLTFIPTLILGPIAEQLGAGL